MSLVANLYNINDVQLTSSRSPEKWALVSRSGSFGLTLPLQVSLMKTNFIYALGLQRISSAQHNALPKLANLLS